MKTIIRYLKYGSIPSVIINFAWHMCSLTPCSMLERVTGWSIVWLVISATIWTLSGIVKRITPFMAKIFRQYATQFEEPYNHSM